MSSIHLLSFFNNQKNASSTTLNTKSMIFRRSTFTTSQEFMNTETTMPEYELTRSNTLSKKVKRFGSMLVRGKKSSRPHMPHFLSTPTIDVDLKKNASLSSFSDSEEEFEENLMTPIDSISPQVIPNTESPSPFFPISKASTPVTNNNDVLEACFRNASSYTPIDDDQLKLNLALLVKGQLSDAFEVADKEIEADLEISSRAMLISIQHGTFAI